MSMISGQPERPELLRQYELGAVPYQMGHEGDETGGPHDARGKKGQKPKRRRWFRLFRRH